MNGNRTLGFMPGSLACPERRRAAQDSRSITVARGSRPAACLFRWQAPRNAPARRSERCGCRVAGVRSAALGVIRKFHQAPARHHHASPRPMGADRRYRRGGLLGHLFEPGVPAGRRHAPAGARSSDQRYRRRWAPHRPRAQPWRAPGDLPDVRPRVALTPRQSRPGGALREPQARERGLWGAHGPRAYQLWNYSLDVVPHVPFGPDYADLPKATWITPSTAQARICFSLDCHHHITSYAAMIDDSFEDWGAFPAQDQPYVSCIKRPSAA